jgi:PAS domain S-box-containing protein
VPEAFRRPELARIRIGDLPVFIGDAIERRATAASIDGPARALVDNPFMRALPVQPQSILYAPVLQDARLKGALVSYWWREPHVVTDHDIELATNVARQTALALSGTTEQRYRGLFERSLAGMFRTRRDGHITDCNPAFARMLGYDTPADLIGRHASQFYMDAADRERIVADVRRTGAAVNRDVMLRRRDGSAVAVLLNLARPPGEPQAVYEGQILDISDRLAAETAQREATALRSVATLANGAAHSINNPLTVIRGTLELIVQRAEEKVTLQRIAPALRAIEQISDIVRGMAQISRLELVPNAPGEMRMLDIHESGSELPDPKTSSPASDPPRATS